MSTLMPAAAAAAVPAAGWSAHAWWLRRRLSAARRDPLTGLYRRDAFEATARRILRRRLAAVVMVDLDGFKQLNDAHGHAAGDAALRVAATALTDAAEVSGGGACGRLGGDEFAAVVPLRVAYGLPWLLGGLHGQLSAPFAYGGRTLAHGASIGAVAAAAGTGLSAALRAADEAMYAAKRAGGGWRTADAPGPYAATAAGRRAGRPGTHLTSGEEPTS